MNKPTAVLILSYALFALATPLAKWLSLNGLNLGTDGHRLISFCNVLFIGNLCAALLILLYRQPQKLIQDYLQMGTKAHCLMLLCGSLSAIVPSLLFIALEHTSVANTVLLSRTGPVLFAIVGTLVFRQKLTKWELIGFGFIICSVLVTALFATGSQLGRGEILILSSGIFFAITATVSKLTLPLVPSRVFLFCRNFYAAIVFLIVAMYLYGPEHFSDAFHPRLWVVMTIYAIVAIIFAQVTWFYALKRAKATTIGSWSFLSPALTIFFGFALLHEKPSGIQLIALTLMMIGILTSNYKTLTSFAQRWLSQSPESSIGSKYDG